MEFNKKIHSILVNDEVNSAAKNQLKRAGLSITLNIAESSSRFTSADRRRYLIISRGSVFECNAILEHLLSIGVIDEKRYRSFYNELETISKILYSLIRNLE